MKLDKVYTFTIGGKTLLVDCPKVVHAGDATIEPNVYNDFGTITTLSITKGNDKPNVINCFLIRFTATAETSVTFVGWELHWVGGNAPTFTDGKMYEISIIDNLAICVNS